MVPARRTAPGCAIAAISEHFQHAFVAVEDHRFYLHTGVDPIALGRAVMRNVREPGTVEGGSTITQQLARTLFLSNRKSYIRKVREAILSVLIEGQLTKAQILELYLNRIYLSAGIYGVEAMSRRVFDKPAKNLTLAESALIAGLARAPATLSPWNNLDGRGRAQPCRACAHARRRLHHPRRGARSQTARSFACARIAVRTTAVTVTRRTICASVFATASAAIIRRTGASTRRSSRELQDIAEATVGNGLQRFGLPELQAALVASTRRPETSSPSSAGGAISALPSIVPAAVNVSQGRPSNRFCSRPRSNAGSRRYRR